MSVGGATTAGGAIVAGAKSLSKEPLLTNSVTYYDTLKISQFATPAEVREAYRALARVHHPDRDSGGEEIFKEINEAHHILSNPSRRSMYDLGLSRVKRWAANEGSAGERQASQRSVCYDQTLAFRNVLSCIVICAAALACVLYGDRPYPNYSGGFVGLFWLLVIVGASRYRYRRYRFASPGLFIWTTTIDMARLLRRHPIGSVMLVLVLIETFSSWFR
jgi:hypothetical protein